MHLEIQEQRSFYKVQLSLVDDTKTRVMIQFQTGNNLLHHMQVKTLNTKCQMYTPGQVTEQYKNLRQWHELKSHVTPALTLYSILSKQK